MTPEGFYWATISAILFSMLLARKEGVETLITIAGVGMLYASGSVGYIYTTIYNSFENDYIIDVIFLSVLMGLIYLLWTVFFTLSEIVSGNKNLIRYFSNLGITLLSFFGVGILAFLYILLCYNASSIVCSLAIPIIIFAFTMGKLSSKEKFGDDLLTFALIGSIIMCGIMFWFNNLLENYNIVIASGCYIHEYTYGASFVFAALLTLPIFLAIRFIGYNLIKYEDRSDQANTFLIDTNINKTEDET